MVSLPGSDGNAQPGQPGQITRTIDASKHFRPFPNLVACRNTSLQKAPPPVLAEVSETTYGQPQVTRCWLNLDEIWDYREQQYHFNFQIGVDKYRDVIEKHRETYDWEVCNEYSLDGFIGATDEEYYEFYKLACQAVYEVNEELDLCGAGRVLVGGPNEPDTRADEIRMLPIGASMKFLSMHKKGREVLVDNSVESNDIVLVSVQKDRILVEAVNYSSPRDVDLTIQQTGKIFPVAEQGTFGVRKYLTDSHHSNCLANPEYPGGIQKIEEYTLNGSHGEIRLHHDSLEKNGLVLWEVFIK